MTTSFNELKPRDKIFVNFSAEFVQSVNEYNGYLEIQTASAKDANLKPWQGWHYYIPHNHLKANKLKLQNGLWLHLTKTGYKRYMNNFINEQLNK